MRRGHSGIGGWRNENPRHFRPRGGGIPHYGPPLPYPLLDFPPKYGGPRSGPRFHRGAPHYNIHSAPPNRHYVYRKNQQLARHSDRGDLDHDRFSYPQQPIMRHNDSTEHVSPYKNMLDFCESRSKNNLSHINNMGDVDHRQNMSLPERFEASRQQPVPPWANPPENRTCFEDRSPHKQPNRSHDNVDVNQVPAFTGHRPPTSDDYGGNISSAIENSNSFSRSVDDTVDIVRKRLLNRNESQNTVDNPAVEQNPEERTDMAAVTSIYQNDPQTPPTRKRIQRRGQNVKLNCDKIKNKIVHQLFKMDKEKIHKLMDNPSSSTKFEFAISSLITESQNSLDRHLRSVAEKSLCSSSAEFIHNDNNTIYEDTFLKQMQCILEPQDTVLLEDIKPLVMAELTKVLQLDKFDQRFDLVEEDPNHYPMEEQAIDSNFPREYEYTDFSKDCFLPTYPEEENSYQKQQFSQTNFPAQDTPESPPCEYNHEELLFERRPPKNSCDSSELRRKSPENRNQARRSADRERHRLSEERHKCEMPVPVFDPNVEQLSEEEDPFADLDQQYHVAVDRNFIEAELDKPFMSAIENSPSETGSITKKHPINSDKEKSPTIKRDVLLSPEKDPNTLNIEKEIDSHILNIAKLSPLTLDSSIETVRKNQNQRSSQLQKRPAKSEHLNLTNVNNDASTGNQNQEIYEDQSNQEQIPESNNAHKEKEISENFVKSTILSNARKRSIDQKPSHRKEKRKKSESTPVEPNRKILNKNIIINVNDCASKSSEKKCDAAKSIFNLFFSKDESEKEIPKENKNIEIGDKGYSDKYVKRKDTPIKKELESKRNRSSSISHSIESPKENNSSCSEAQSKMDVKIKLKPIDMFSEHPKKVLSSHQSHRNTAQPQAVTPKKVEDKTPPKGPKTKSSKRHVGTQILLKMHAKETQTSFLKSSISKLCQTEIKNLTVKATQTSPPTIEKSGIKSSDAFERMKEIDLEIQELIQEKFKLYNSLEARESCSNAAHNLGMTVLNVSPIEESKEEEVNEDVALSEDAIVEGFTSIPVEELEQIALESVQELPSETPKVKKRNQRQKISQERDTTPVKTRSSPVNTYVNDKTVNAPNISLIEQIITDDRPLEDIISLDDLESIEESKPTAPPKKKKPQRPQRATRRKAPRRSKTFKPNNAPAQSITRECSVVLTRVDFKKYQSKSNVTKTEKPLQKEPVTNLVQKPKHNVIKEKPAQKRKSVANKVKETIHKETKTENPPHKKEAVDDFIQEPIIETAEVTEVVGEQTIQFDMLDVSEDIVIGDVCEIKSSEEKAERDLSVSEEVILDNSQSSCDDVMPSEMGQHDNECKMFDYSADEMLRRDSITVTGNADAVLAIECIENNFIAACLDGNVYHFNNEGQLLTTLRGSNLAVTCLTIVKEKYGTTVYTGSLDSRIRYYDLETGLEKGPECNVLSPIQTMDRAWDTVFVGTRTGFVLQFQCKNNMLIPISTVKFSEQSILALRALKEGPRKVLLVAARSENVTIKDAQTGLLLRTLEGPKMTVYTLLFEDGKVYCGTSSHQIHVFDYSSGSHCGSHDGGKGCVCLRATGGLLFAGCYDGCVYVYREGEPRPFAQLRGPGLMLLSLAIVGTKIIAGYKDRSLYIWKIPLSILKEMIL